MPAAEKSVEVDRVPIRRPGKVNPNSADPRDLPPATIASEHVFGVRNDWGKKLGEWGQGKPKTKE